MNRLHVDSIRKQIGEQQILNDIFISCEPGEIIGLLGRNGSGKSTLLKIIFGSLSADNKFITINNKKSGNLFQNRNKVHYLPQDHYLPNHIKIKNLISCFCNRQNTAIMVEDDFLKPLLNKKVKELSGGERRILEIMLMVYSDAKYLLFDEPFNGIAPIHIETIKDIIKQHSKNKGFIITDHDYENVIDISSKIILMDNGNTKVIKELEELVLFDYLPSSTAEFILGKAL